MFDDEPVKRTLGIRDRQILYERAGRKCQGCGREISYTEMEVGHKRAFSKGGSTGMKNCVCLCGRCNKLQGTDSWNTFHRKMGNASGRSRAKGGLQSLSMTQLKYLANKHDISVKGKIVEDWFDTIRKSPTKKQYINALSKVVSESEIQSVSAAKPVAKRKKRRSSDSWSFW